MSRVGTGLGTRSALLVVSLAQGCCGARSGAGCSVKRGDGRGPALGGEARGSGTGAGRLGFGLGALGIAAALSRGGRPSGWRPQFWVEGPEDGLGARRASPGGCAGRPPVRGAGSPKRAGAAGRWGPGRPCWASAPHPGRTGGRGGGGPAPPRLWAWRDPLASRPRRARAAPTAAPEPR